MVLFLVFFLLVTGDLFKRKLVKIAGPTLTKKKITVQIMDEINQQISGFLRVQVFTSAVVAVRPACALWWFGVAPVRHLGVVRRHLQLDPLPRPVDRDRRASASWRSCSSTTCSRPRTSAGIAMAITSLEGWLLTPALMSRAAQMNPVAIFVGLLFWSWVWGVWGTILAVPMMMMVKAICDHVEDLQPRASCWGNRGSFQSQRSDVRSARHCSPRPKGSNDARDRARRRGRHSSSAYDSSNHPRGYWGSCDAERSSALQTIRIRATGKIARSGARWRHRNHREQTQADAYEHIVPSRRHHARAGMAFEQRQIAQVRLHGDVEEIARTGTAPRACRRPRSRPSGPDDDRRAASGPSAGESRGEPGVARSPIPGISPTMASRPKRMVVPGTRNPLSSRSAQRRSASSTIGLGSLDGTWLF